MPQKTRIEIKYIAEDLGISEFDHKLWRIGNAVKLESYWSGEKAPSQRHAEARLLWSENAFYIRFEANQFEPLIISENFDLAEKTLGLWDRDVCEIFVAPDAENPYHYFEFEAAPTGEWVDLEIHWESAGQKTNKNYDSGMKCAAKIITNKILVIMKIEWKAFDKKPEPDEIWLGNIFRVLGKGESRGYLAWQPTETEIPDYHVPEKFGEFEFVN